ncbi:MAG: hypothetical protein AB8H80_00730 [Planctomycetota bacterium]
MHVFDGTDWQPLSGGPDGTVNTLLALANGDLIAGGSFATIGGGPPGGSSNAANIARWDGQAWSSLGSGAPGRVAAMRILPTFTSAGLPSDVGVARWGGPRRTRATASPAASAHTKMLGRIVHAGPVRNRATERVSQQVCRASERTRMPPCSTICSTY